MVHIVDLKSYICSIDIRKNQQRSIKSYYYQLDEVFFVRYRIVIDTLQPN